MVASVSAIGYFLPIFAFLFVFVVAYAMLKKTEVLGDNDFVALLISFILASFFIVQASLVEFVQFTTGWFGVGIIGLFFLMVMIAFLPGDSPKIFFEKKWFGWVIFGIMIIFFIVSAGYVFETAINWALIKGWLATDWFGMILLLVIGGIVAWRVKGKVSK
jgi:hypothetical protein